MTPLLKDIPLNPFFEIVCAPGKTLAQKEQFMDAVLRLTETREERVAIGKAYLEFKKFLMGQVEFETQLRWDCLSLTDGRLQAIESQERNVEKAARQSAPVYQEWADFTEGSLRSIQALVDVFSLCARLEEKHKATSLIGPHADLSQRTVLRLQEEKKHAGYLVQDALALLADNQKTLKG